MKTVSEQRFEEYCAARGYIFSKIDLPTSEGTGRRPDYRVKTPAGEIIFEVKQIEPGEWEKRKDEENAKRVVHDFSRPLGEKIRERILAAAPQLKKFKAEKTPCALVIMDLTGYDYLSGPDMDAGMFGEPVVYFNSGGKPTDQWRNDFGHGGERRLTDREKRYISAVCELRRHELALKIYHNPFATVPLHPSTYLPHPADTHYFKKGHPDAVGHSWCKYVGPRLKETSAP